MAILPMLGVLIIAMVFLVVAIVLFGRRPLRDGSAEVDAERRRMAIIAIVCFAVGVLLLLPPFIFLILALLMPS